MKKEEGRMGRERWNAEKGESKNREGEEDKGKGGWKGEKKQSEKEGRSPHTYF